MKRITLCLSAFLFLVSLTTNTLAAATEDKLYASDGAALDNFGNTVSISGNNAIVGAVFADPDGDNSGAAYIYHFDGSSWVEQQKLTASDGAANNRFGGWSVSISGNNAIVGAYYGDGNEADSGAAYIYHFDGYSWVEQQKLIASDGGVNHYYGYSVSISGDFAIVGAYRGNAAYIYHFDGYSWVEQQKLIASDTAYNSFGISVAISSNYAIVGADGDDDLGNASGAAYIFYYDGVNWLEVQKLTASDGAAEDRFGGAVSISGNYAIFGAKYAEGFVTDSGAAYIYHFDGSSWVEQQKLFAYNEEYNSFFGSKVSIEGDNAIVGDMWFGDHDIGAAYIFHYDGSSWVAAEMLSASDGADMDHFGSSVSIFGNKALVGAHSDDDLGNSSGSVYVFTDYSTDLVSYDPDNDGYEWDVDCNNHVASIYPGAVEFCNDLLDNDCDGITDELDCTQQVADFDNDGYETPADCNDNDPAINPGASEDSYELCTDGADNNCNDLTDINDLACQVDIDSDGYILAEDCNDSNPFVNPGATEDSYELCNDGEDNNCDGLIDIWEFACTDDYDLDGFPVMDDCNDDDPNINPGEVEDCTDGIDNDCDFLIDAQDPDAVGCIATTTTTTTSTTTTTLPPTTTTLPPTTTTSTTTTTTTTTTLPSTTTCADIMDKGTCQNDPNCEWVGSPKSGTCQDIPAAEICDSGIDEDGDGLIDCDDPDCAGVGSCPSLSCSEIPDKDSCISDPNCEWVGSPKNGTCEDVAVCVPDQTPEVTCTDGVDNDCDGMIDCADTADCGADPACQGGSCDTYTDKTSCQSNGCTWDNKGKVCM